MAVASDDDVIEISSGDERESSSAPKRPRNSFFQSRRRLGTQLSQSQGSMNDGCSGRNGSVLEQSDNTEKHFSSQGLNGSSGTRAVSAVSAAPILRRYSDPQKQQQRPGSSVRDIRSSLKVSGDLSFLCNSSMRGRKVPSLSAASTALSAAGRGVQRQQSRKRTGTAVAITAAFNKAPETSNDKTADLSSQQLRAPAAVIRRKSVANGTSSSASSACAAMPVAAPVVKHAQLWVDKYAPQTSSDLAVHAKKVSEVRNWIVDALSDKPSIHAGRRVLICSGPPGSGRTATVQVLCRELSVQVLEWQNSTQMTKFSSDGSLLPELSESYVPRDVEFSEWMFSTRRRRTLAFDSDPSDCARSNSLYSGQVGQSIVLVEDLPACYSIKSATTCQQAFRSFVTSGNGELSSQNLMTARPAPLIIVINFEDLSRSTELSRAHIHSSGSISALPSEWRALLLTKQTSGGGRANPMLPSGVSCIHFNPIADTYIKRRLMAIAKAEQLTAGDDILRPIIEESHGDIRQAILNLQLHASAGAVAVSKSGNPGSRSTDRTISVLHAVGKLLTAKRTADGELGFEPETVLARCRSAAPSHVLNYLHSNFLNFFAHVGGVCVQECHICSTALSVLPDPFVPCRSDDCANFLEILSITDILENGLGAGVSGGLGVLTQQQAEPYIGSLGVRASTSFNNHPNQSKFTPITRATWPQVRANALDCSDAMRADAANARSVQLLRHSTAVLSTDSDLAFQGRRFGCITKTAVVYSFLRPQAIHPQVSSDEDLESIDSDSS